MTAREKLSGILKQLVEEPDQVKRLQIVADSEELNSEIEGADNSVVEELQTQLTELQTKYDTDVKTLIEKVFGPASEEDIKQDEETVEEKPKSKSLEELGLGDKRMNNTGV